MAGPYVSLFLKWWEQAPNPSSLLTLLDKYNEKSKKGIILEVDLEYPKELHYLHNDYPCATEKNKRY